MSEYKDLKPFEERKQPTFTYPDGREVSGKLIDEVYVDSKDIDENTKGIVYRNLVQQIKLDNEEVIFRFCYYRIDLDKENPIWLFSRYALMVNNREFKELLNKILEKGWISANILFI